ncbi:MAG: nucleotide disphospho-sugar-binding domain-containing protein [Pseudomonadota bacterium]
MARILCAWEFGAGLGHLTRLLPVARRLHDAGHDITLAVPNTDAAKPVLEKNFPDADGPFGLTVIPGTQWKIPTNDPDLRKKPTHVLADVLQLFHYQEPTLLEKQTRVWKRIVDKVDPDLIVADFAPTLRLAYWGHARFAMTGNGYTVPPAGRMLPPIKPWQERLHPFSRMHEAGVLMGMNRVRQNLGGPPVHYVGDMLNGDRSFICTINEFDPYRPHRREPTLVPFNVPQIDQSPTIEERGGERAPVFIYLPHNHPQLRDVLHLASRLTVPVHVYVSGAPAEKVAAICGQNVAVHRKPLNFQDDLWKFRAIIHHAGLATAYAAIKAGTPQLLLPVHLEHAITARGAVDLAGAISLGSQDNPTVELIEQALSRLLTDRAIWQRAHKAAVEVRQRPEMDSVSHVVEGCLAMLDEGIKRREAYDQAQAKQAEATETMEATAADDDDIDKIIA